MLGALQRVAQSVKFTPDAARGLLSQHGTSEEKWNSSASFANIRRGSTANLEGEPSALPYGYAACPMRLRN
jgi:hypothetical protein